MVRTPRTSCPEQRTFCPRLRDRALPRRQVRLQVRQPRGGFVLCVLGRGGYRIVVLRARPAGAALRAACRRAGGARWPRLADIDRSGKVDVGDLLYAPTTNSAPTIPPPTSTPTASSTSATSTSSSSCGPEAQGGLHAAWAGTTTAPRSSTTKRASSADAPTRPPPRRSPPAPTLVRRPHRRLPAQLQQIEAPRPVRALRVRQRLVASSPRRRRRARLFRCTSDD